MSLRKRVLLADYQDVVCAGLQWLLGKHDCFEVVGQAGDGLEALRQARKTQPDLVLMDVCMPRMNGIDAARQIKKDVRHTRIVIVSALDGRQSVLDSLAAGAGGYILKTRVTDELMPAIKAALRGDIYLSPPVAKYVAYQPTGSSQRLDDASADVLSLRERQVLQQVAEGKSSKQIAYALELEESTVAVHRRNIMNKLGLHSVAELTRYAILHGITPLELPVA
jgi:DNA-binding NarL/FixJ family response regulator